jgi:hypothetical protein
MSIEMADPDPKLWCLVEGYTNPFSVTPSNISIDWLKKLIKEETKIDHPAFTLNLWKVRYFW